LSKRNHNKVGPADFEKIQILGRGNVGRVYLVKLKQTGEYFAMKVLGKKEMIQRNKVKNSVSTILVSYAIL